MSGINLVISGKEYRLIWGIWKFIVKHFIYKLEDYFTYEKCSSKSCNLVHASGRYFSFSFHSHRWFYIVEFLMYFCRIWNSLIEFNNGLGIRQIFQGKIYLKLKIILSKYIWNDFNWVISNFWKKEKKNHFFMWTQFPQRFFYVFFRF